VEERKKEVEGAMLDGNLGFIATGFGD